MNQETKVRYVKDRVEITMPKIQYARMCSLYNHFNDALDEFSETFDIRISEVQNMHSLRWFIRAHLGFVPVNENEYRFGDQKIPDNGGK